MATSHHDDSVMADIHLRTPPLLSLHDALTVALKVLFENERADALEAYIVLKQLRDDECMPQLSSAGRTLRRCQRCGKPFVTWRPDFQRYCSHSCRQWAYRSRQRGGLTA